MLCVVNLCDWELQVSLTLPRSGTRSKLQLCSLLSDQQSCSKLQLCSLLSDQRSCCFRTSIFLSALLYSLSSFSCLLLSPTPLAYLISLPFLSNTALLYPMWRSDVHLTVRCHSTGHCKISSEANVGGCSSQARVGGDAN
jgi:hypothetical protein